MAIGNPITLTSNVASKTISAVSTSGQTLFTVTGGYRLNQIAVFRNGTKLVEAIDFTARDGASVTLQSPATVGDILEFEVFDTFRVADAVNANDDNVNFGGTVNIQGNLNVIGVTTIAGAATSVAFATTAFNLSGTASTATAAATAYGLTGSPNITVGNITGSGATFTDLTVNGTQTIINTTSLEVADKNIGIGSTSTPSDITADGAGITIYGTTNKTITWNNNSDDFAFSNGIDIKGAVETVSTGSTYDLGGGKVILECDARNGTVFTHNLANGIVGITSFKNFPVTKNSATTFTILFTQNATGTANTTAATGIGTNVYLTPYGVSGFTTTSKVSAASTVILSTTANDVDIVSFMVHYNGSGTGTLSNYKVYATNNTGFRYGSVGF
jgi:hypothetical protein